MTIHSIKKIGITLIATGFEHKDPFAKPVEPKKAEPKQEKIVMTLDLEAPKQEEKVEAPQPVQQTLPLEDKDPFAPRMEEVAEVAPMLNLFSAPAIVEQELPAAEEQVENFTLQFELSPEITAEVVVPEPPAEEVHINKTIVQDELLQFKVNEQPQQPVGNTLFSKPMNIYAEPEMPAQPAPQPVQEVKPVIAEIKETPAQEEEPSMQLIEKEETPAPKAVIPPSSFIDDSVLDDAEEQKRRAAERIQRLRNLSFNTNAGDANEFDNVPAYVRRNMELFGNTLTSVEDFYSKYTVGKDENNQAQISTINTFLDGKKPD